MDLSYIASILSLILANSIYVYLLYEIYRQKKYVMDLWGELKVIAIICFIGLLSYHALALQFLTNQFFVMKIIIYIISIIIIVFSIITYVLKFKNKNND
jgi:phosphatidylglycerophosphate synthase